MGTCRKELAEAVIEDCYELSLTDALKKHGVKPQNFFPTLSLVPSLDEKFMRAQQARAELYMAEMIGIADNESIDPNRARNMILVREKYAAKLHPKKFSDRIDINVNTQIDIRGALDEAKNRVRNVLDISNSLAIEEHKEIDLTPTGSKPVENVGTVKNELDELLE